jgi:hypothetical protein
MQDGSCHTPAASGVFLLCLGAARSRTHWLPDLAKRVGPRVVRRLRRNWSAAPCLFRFAGSQRLADWRTTTLAPLQACRVRCASVEAAVEAVGATRRVQGTMVSRFHRLPRASDIASPSAVSDGDLQPLCHQTCHGVGLGAPSSVRLSQRPCAAFPAECANTLVAAGLLHGKF